MSGRGKITERNLLVGLEAEDFDGLVAGLAACAAGLPEAIGAGLDAAAIAAAVAERERQDSTACGNGVLLPHARFDALGRVELVVATLKRPLALPTPDERPIRVACLVLIPADHPMDGLKLLSGLARLLVEPGAVAALTAAETPEKVLMLRDAAAFEAPETLSAGDLLAAPRLTSAPAEPLANLTAKMAAGGVEIVPVLEDGKLVGEVVCSELFKLGIPDFFSRLTSVGFIRYFDPFDKYFEIAGRTAAGEAMRRDFCALPPDATLIEVVFALSVKKYGQVNVVDADGRLLGVIGQASLLERIINM